MPATHVRQIILSTVRCASCHSAVPLELVWAADDLCPRCLRALDPGRAAVGAGDRRNPAGAVAARRLMVGSAA